MFKPVLETMDRAQNHITEILKVGRFREISHKKKVDFLLAQFRAADGCKTPPVSFYGFRRAQKKKLKKIFPNWIFYIKLPRFDFWPEKGSKRA